MKIVSWNVAGLRARMSRGDLARLLFASTNTETSYYNYFDIVCLQETKCEPGQITLPCEIQTRYPHRYWNSTMGTTQRRGFSGTAIFSSIQPLCQLDDFAWDEEGRIIALEYQRFILVNVYVPNSQAVDSERANFRIEWDKRFHNTCKEVHAKYRKSLIICGDLNVARTANDIVDPKRKQNRVPGFLDSERLAIETTLIHDNSLVDVYRHLYPDSRSSTYWSNFLRQPRAPENGWRIDYFLVSHPLIRQVKNIIALKDTIGSDHCPLVSDLREIIEDNSIE
jgi:exodeoxyribonuclease-3